MGVLDGRDGTFAELLAGTAKSPCLVLFEMRRYTNFSRALAKQCRKRGVPVVMICDHHCHWAVECADAIFTVSAESNLFWDSQTPFVSLTNLMLDDVARKLKKAASGRLKALRTLQDCFGASRIDGKRAGEDMSPPMGGQAERTAPGLPVVEAAVPRPVNDGFVPLTLAAPART